MEIFGHNRISTKILNFPKVFALGSKILRTSKQIVWMYMQDYQ